MFIQIAQPGNKQMVSCCILFNCTEARKSWRQGSLYRECQGRKRMKLGHWLFFWATELTNPEAWSKVVLPIMWNSHFSYRTCQFKSGFLLVAAEGILTNTEWVLVSLIDCNKAAWKSLSIQEWGLMMFSYNAFLEYNLTYKLDSFLRVEGVGIEKWLPARDH